MVEATEVEGDGTCFQDAFDYMQEMGGVLVHGQPIYRGQGPMHGQRFWHAWVERGEGAAAMVHDHANGRTIDLPKKLYYIVGRLTDEHVHRFTKDEALDLMQESMIWGPWAGPYLERAIANANLENDDD